MIKRIDLEKLESSSLAPYAMKSGESQGRQHPEEEHQYRTRFQRDRDRIIHTSAFRRLEYKTQVFVYHEGDYYRTRLTHSLEVAQIARSICKSLQLNEDLAESVALSHDLGHPPFGHTGQDVLNRLMKEHGGFEHNKQSLRIVKLLEKRYPEFDGLNLTWEVLEGISKHTKDEENPITSTEGVRYPSLEAQIADLADGIAYNAHDLDDGITSDLLDLSQLRQVALWRENEDRFDEKYSGLDFKLKKYQVVRSIINEMITDLREATLKNIEKYNVKSADEVRQAPSRIAAFGKEVAEKNKELKKFLHKNMYSHRRVLRMEFKADLTLEGLFAAYTKMPGLLPESVLKNESHGPLERRICDYVSGMTDRYALNEHKNLYSSDEES
ncbi:MAG: deoxyguanosinetriphosphate triphosphohydrolase [Nitrospinae bacterium]|nr:deoxyguanosinetriphosphate triphosphohydrolase [Nitrospinota bacterium]MZH04651.1 deoxyguanosinetriphosphate triphosphohydrolase [Nitrospinota bacterium]MZH13996.1 deoxyguanosinetriphosphate triphosphohydrolase [Nitrospinota bacterium]